MEFRAIIQCVIPRCQTYLPFAIGNKDLKMIASRALLNMPIDILYLQNVIRDCEFITTSKIDGQVDLVLLAIHLFFNGLDWLDAITENAWFITANLHLATNNHYGPLHP